MKRPKSQGQTRFLKETPKLFKLKGTLLENQRFTETITLSPKKANSKYNVFQERLPFFDRMACSLQYWSAP
ncbi:cag pathogenicity island protein [Helicobacter pylori]|uniref:cag pathogenicity island protein n=1 Tax=Helicobacter pylori TaxID=210 RepID=UPI001F0994BD|nr:cag pathogenicity island protein [Helicobacter pylori]